MVLSAPTVKARQHRAGSSNLRLEMKFRPPPFARWFGTAVLVALGGLLLLIDLQTAFQQGLDDQLVTLSHGLSGNDWVGSAFLILLALLFVTQPAARALPAKAAIVFGSEPRASLATSKQYCSD